MYEYMFVSFVNHKCDVTLDALNDLVINKDYLITKLICCVHYFRYLSIQNLILFGKKSKK